MIARLARLDAIWIRIIAAAVVICTTIFAYRGIELNGFHYDDWPNILNHAPVRMDDFSVDGLISAARTPFLPRRPIPSLTFAIDWWRGGGTPAAFLVTNLALHVAVALAVLALIRRSLATSEAIGARSALLAATGATLWWALQPIHVQTVSYAVQRMTELAALFSILSVWAYLNGRQSAHRTIPWMAASLAFMVLAVSCKENAWITPALLLLAEYLPCRERRPLLQHRHDRWVLALPVALALAASVDLAADGPLSQWALYGYDGRDFTMIERLLTQPKVVLFHVSQLLWPMPGRFSLEHDVEIVRSAASADFWLPMLAIVAWCAAGIHFALREHSRTIGFFILWIPTSLLIESSFVPLQLIFEHRMYLPTVGLAGLFGLLLARISDLPRPAAFGAGIAIASLTALSAWSTAQRIPQWRDDVTLYQQAVHRAPKSAGAWNQLAMSYLEKGLHEKALQAISRAIEIEPRWGDGYPFVNRGVILEAMGRPELARTIYDQTIELFPRQVLGYNNRGLLNLRARRPEQALPDFERAVEADPTYAPAWTNRGTAHLFLGNRIQARSDFERAVALSPHERLALHHLAQILAAEGRVEEAANLRLRACRLGISSDCTDRGTSSSSIQR